MKVMDTISFPSGDGRLGNMYQHSSSKQKAKKNRHVIDWSKLESSRQLIRHWKLWRQDF